MSIESVLPSNHLILCRPLLLLPPIFPSIRVFSNGSVLHIRWPKYWSFSFSISLSSEYSGLISFRMDWSDLLEVQGTLKGLLQHHSSEVSILRCSAFCIHHTLLCFIWMVLYTSHSIRPSYFEILPFCITQVLKLQVQARNPAKDIHDPDYPKELKPPGTEESVMMMRESDSREGWWGLEEHSCGWAALGFSRTTETENGDRGTSPGGDYRKASLGTLAGDR